MNLTWHNRSLLRNSLLGTCLLCIGNRLGISPMNPNKKQLNMDNNLATPMIKKNMLC